MNGTLKNILYIVGGILAGVLIALLLIFLKLTQNQPGDGPLRDRIKAGKVSQISAAEAEGENSPVILHSHGNAEGTVEAAADDFTESIKNAEHTGPVFDDDDLIKYLGKDFSEIQSYFGSSEQVLSSENQYFQEECLSVSYDGSNRQVLVIENDSVGENPVKICNFSAGMDREEIYTIIYARMTEGDMYDDFDTLSYIDTYEGTPFEVDITFKKDEAAKVTLRLYDGDNGEPDSETVTSEENEEQL